MTYPTVPVPAGFYWTDAPWGAVLRCRPLDDVAPHLFTTRELPLSDAASYRRVAEAIGAAAAATLTQVHGRDVVVVREGDFRLEPEALTDRPAGDAFVSIASDVAVIVRAADCVPVLMGDPKTGAVAAVHAGWRGTCARAVNAAVDALTRHFGARPGDLIAAIGPSIGPCCYAVGAEIVEAFTAADHPAQSINRWFTAAAGTYRLDLWAANRDQLVAAGVDEEHVHVSALCTASHVNLFYSYRVEGIGTGRLAAAIRAANAPPDVLGSIKTR